MGYGGRVDVDITPILFGLKELFKSPEQREQERSERAHAKYFKSYKEGMLLPPGEPQRKFFETRTKHEPNLLGKIFGAQPRYYVEPPGGKLSRLGFDIEAHPESGIYFPESPPISPERETFIKEMAKKRYPNDPQRQNDFYWQLLTKEKVPAAEQERDELDRLGTFIYGNVAGGATEEEAEADLAKKDPGGYRRWIEHKQQLEMKKAESEERISASKGRTAEREEKKRQFEVREKRLKEQFTQNLDYHKERDAEILKFKQKVFSVGRLDKNQKLQLEAAFKKAQGRMSAIREENNRQWNYHKDDPNYEPRILSTDDVARDLESEVGLILSQQIEPSPFNAPAGGGLTPPPQQKGGEGGDDLDKLINELSVRYEGNVEGRR